MSSEDRDSGFTMIELLVTISLLGIMMIIAVSGWTAWAKASRQSGTARELQSVMRQAQVRAVTEGRAICVDFRVIQNDYTLYRGACDDTAKVKIIGPVVSDSKDVKLTAPSFTGPSGPAGSSTGVTFNARGTAWPGSVQLTRTGSSKSYTLTVEGLTGRVSLN
jgi:prepilin-type N-terminal cleavage/methylation domain-containing protein